MTQGVKGTGRGDPWEARQGPHSIGGRVVLFECMHDTTFKSGTIHLRRGDVLICVRCNAARIVKEVRDEARVQCRTCLHTRGFGLSELAASAYAVSHSKRLGHETYVMVGSRRIERYRLGITPGQASLDELEDVPPF